jgi:iron transport multicopper oxidase
LLIIIMRPSLAILAAVSPVLAGVQELWWDIGWINNINPDGLQPRRVIGVNGSWPPPPIDIQSTDSLILHATNLLDKPATLHHHGMFFNSTSWFDGAMQASHCGIPPGQKLDYVVPINSSGQFGTFWIHSHAFGQYVDGMRSSLVIHPQSEVYHFDDEFTVVLGDWYHTEHDILLSQFINVSNPNGNEPVPDSSVMYFSHRGRNLGPRLGTYPQSGSAVGFNENATLPFVPGKTYRLRIINTAAFSSFFFRIDGHNMTIIEADGIDTQKEPISMVGIAVAQRYSVLVTARSDTSNNFAIHADMDQTMFFQPSLNPNITASITYDPDAPLVNLGTVSSTFYVDDQHLVPVKVTPAPTQVTQSIELAVLFSLMTDGTNRAMFNLVTYNQPLLPMVFSERTLGANASVISAYGPQSFLLNHLDVIDLVVQNGDTGAHPFHLHGHKFQIVGRSANFSSTDPTQNPPIAPNQPNPMTRDTIFINAGASATLRFVADNPGGWLFHCHIEWHLESGLAVQMIEAPLLAQQRNTPPAVMFQQCLADGLPDSGNAAGHASTTDLTGLTIGPFPVSS